MQIRIQLGQSFHTTAAKLGAAADALAAAANDGLLTAAASAAEHCRSRFLSGQYLKVRTGTLRRELASWQVAPGTVAIGIPKDSVSDPYKYLLGDDVVTIRPKKAKFLAIPIGENLTSAGVAKFRSPRDVPDGFFVKSKGQLLFGYKKGKTSRAKFRPLFVLKKSVTIHGTGALYDAVDEHLNEMSEIILDRVMEEFE